MSEELNPYAPPKSEWHAVVDENAGLVWQEGGKYAVADHQHVFPLRCVKCNQPVSEATHKVGLTWLHPGFYVLLLPGLFLPVLPICMLVFVLASVIFRKRVRFYIGLCARHKRRLYLGRLLGWVGIVLTICSIMLIGSGQWRIPLGFFLPAVFAWLIGTWALTRLVTAKFIEGKRAHIRGCSKEFLATLPEYEPAVLHKSR